MHFEKYEIGGLSVRMTAGAARRWNDGNLTQHDLRTSRVYDAPRDRNLTLRRATCERLEPEISSMLCGMPANPIS